jgi:hypothetical protein
MYWFKWTYFHERALLFPQCCSQGHSAANAASGGDQFLSVAASGGFAPRR